MKLTQTAESSILASEELPPITPSRSSLERNLSIADVKRNHYSKKNLFQLYKWAPDCCFEGCVNPVNFSLTY